LLLGLGAGGYAILTQEAAGSLRNLLTPLLPKIFAGIPSAIMFMAIIFGVLYEISQPIQSMSTDLVNWLPMTPMEYVAGSTISESYIYSFVLCLLLGAVLGPAISFGMTSTWLATAGLSVLALFVGSFAVEIVDATTNRISSSFYKKSGRTGIVFRLVATVILLMLIQLAFSGYIVGYLLNSIMQAALIAWFVPLVWPSLAVLAASEGNTPNFLFFSAMSLGFAAALFYLAAQFRARFWVPIPVSIKLSSAEYHPGGFRRLPLIGAAESALIQKDLRSLTRRREMARFLAIPFVLAISMGVSIFNFSGPSGRSMGAVDLFFTEFFYVLPLSIFAAALSMTSIGQEGYAVWNLYAAPLKPGQILRAKMIFAATLGIAFGVALLAVFVFISSAIAAVAVMVLIVGLLCVLEVTAIGLCVAVRFPDFREMVRSRYVGVWGSLFGIGCALAVSIITALPPALSIWVYGSVLPVPVVVSVAIGLVIFLSAYKLATRGITRLLQNIGT
jgi:hypothetical protein